MKRLKLLGVKESLGIAGASIGLGVVGNAFNSESISQAGSAASSFIPAAINVGMGATVINMARDLKKAKRR
jgi:hypothetical protein